MATNNAWNSNIPVEIPKGGTNATSMATTNGVNYFDGTRIVTTATGSAGQVLTSNGASAPTFQAGPAGGSWVLIQTQTASNSAILDFTTGISAAYTTYVFVVTNMVPVSNAQVLQLLFSVDGGSSYLSSNYSSGCMSFLVSSVSIANNASTSAVVLSGAINNSAPGASATLYMYNMETAAISYSSGIGFYNSNQIALLAGGNSGTSAVNAFRLQMASGNISSGTASLYALAK